MFKKIAIAATFAVLSSGAMAADRPYFYAGGDVGTTEVDGFNSAMSIGAFAGYQFNQTFGIEAGVRQLGDYDVNGVDLKVTQVSFSALASFPLANGFGLYGRLGLNQLSAKASYQGYSSSESDSKILLGAGATYAFSPTITGRLEVQKPDSDVTNLSAAVKFSF